MIDMNRSVEDLARLEEVAMAGELVTPAKLSAARERVNLATLAAKGAAARDALARREAAAEVREAAKIEAAKVFAAHENDAVEMFHDCVSALEGMIGVLEAGAARVAQAELILRQGGVPARGWDGSYPDGFDPANHASMEQGGRASFIILDGKAYYPQSAALWIAAAVNVVARAHGGLQLPNGEGDLGRRVEFDKPREIAVAYVDE